MIHMGLLPSVTRKINEPVIAFVRQSLEQTGTPRETVCVRGNCLKIVCKTDLTLKRVLIGRHFLRPLNQIFTTLKYLERQQKYWLKNIIEYETLRKFIQYVVWNTKWNLWRALWIWWSASRRRGYKFVSLITGMIYERVTFISFQKANSPNDSYVSC